MKGERERPVEVRTPWFHAEFYLHRGNVKFRALKPSVLGFNLVPGTLKFSLDFRALRDYPTFWKVLEAIMLRHHPETPRVTEDR
jgi:hypothetical protein